jgi:hypothetical protein
MSLPDIELLSTRRISLPHLGHFVRDGSDLSLFQDGRFI